MASSAAEAEARGGGGGGLRGPVEAVSLSDDNSYLLISVYELI